jgi:hypothetical protein
MRQKLISGTFLGYYYGFYQQCPRQQFQKKTHYTNDCFVTFCGRKTDIVTSPGLTLIS